FLSVFQDRPERLLALSLADNNIMEQGLERFSKFINLTYLPIGTNDEKKVTKGIYNRFHGSLEPLKNLSKLKVLDISNTDIDKGYEYLPTSIESFYCHTNLRKNAKVKKVAKLLRKDKSFLSRFRKFFIFDEELPENELSLKNEVETIASKSVSDSEKSLSIDP